MALIALPEETRAIIYGFLNPTSAVALWLTCRDAVTRGWCTTEMSVSAHRDEAGDCACGEGKSFWHRVKPAFEWYSGQTPGLQSEVQCLRKCDNVASLRDCLRTLRLGKVSYTYCRVYANVALHAVIETISQFKCAFTSATPFSSLPECRGEVICRLSGDKVIGMSFHSNAGEACVICASPLITIKIKPTALKMSAIGEWSDKTYNFKTGFNLRALLKCVDEALELHNEHQSLMQKLLAGR